jgi:hypothetical protein
MQKLAKLDLEDSVLVLEHLTELLPKLTREEKVDVAARLRGILNKINKIEDSIKDEIFLWCRGQPGVVKGEIFEANLNLIHVTRLDSKKLKEEEPDQWLKYAKAKDEPRITFTTR